MMRKLLYLLMLVSGFAFGQDYSGEHLDLLIGKELKTKEKEDFYKRFGYDNFYTSPNGRRQNKYLYNSEKTTTRTPYDSLVNKVFKIVSFEKDSEREGYYFLKLENSKTGTLYYNYHSKFKDDFERDFEIIGGFKIPANIVCSENISNIVDKFTKKVTYYTPFEDISFSKFGASIYLKIDIGGSTLNTNEKGLIVLLKDGSKISKPNQKIDVEYNNGYRYSAFVLLNSIEIQRIIKNPITDVKLFIYDSEILNPEKYSEYLKCLTKLQ